MIKISFPASRPQIKTVENKEFIFDPVRKRWVSLTPEEWVRQNFLQYLLQVMQYPASLIAIEKEIRLGELKKRFDIVLYDRNTQPFAIIECKEMKVPLEPKTLDQALRYNIPLGVPYIIITNGSHTYAWHNTGGKLEELEALPGFE